MVSGLHDREKEEVRDAVAAKSLDEKGLLWQKEGLPATQLQSRSLILDSATGRAFTVNKS